MIEARSLFQTLSGVDIAAHTCSFPMEKCEKIAEIANKINALKAEKNALILAHSYISPEIIATVSDFTGDSYELSKRARDSEADLIIFVAVKFMAETAKILNPQKEVRIPATNPGCTLADAITQEQVLALRKAYPEHTFVCYINTSAAVKSVCDVCVTSSNVTKIIERIPNDKIYFLPDKLMAENVVNELKQKGVQKTVDYYKDGTCYVHEAYDPEMIAFIRSQHKDISVISHPECAPNIIGHSDFVGSTSQMINHVKNSSEKEFFLLTECGLTTRLQMEAPDKTFFGTCTLCKYMKSNTLESILSTLESPSKESIIDLDHETIREAKNCIDAMFLYA